ncbi:toxin-antitoxin system HicB family antitoxin [Kibdelosporangium aridum]|uniref:Toxin-antitoxin system HicB family antitoxin n=1 Tax=Kibdelosporangium aridum TaxID=2030 RepID=A0A428Y8J8_KIBAR|nr:toxin-antitoxin system HicB family antitoxin [Kibdelosporangium aridum]RSM63895.1 toxin-antitoxin system HicB family antitoxin [Kibdelosporangium aridum]
MDLTPYVENLRAELAVAAEAGGDDARALAERLTAPLESATRLTLMSALSAAAEEITRDLAPGSVEVRLRGIDPAFVVVPPATPGPAEPEPAPAVAPLADEAATARINFRLPEQLKQRVEQAANRDGVSINTWLVRAVAAMVDADGATRKRGGTWAGQSFSGWVR